MADDRMRIALFVDERGGDWHARRLARAFEARGAVVTVACLKSCAFDTGNDAGVTIPGFRASELPDGAFVRSISDGSLEQITFRLGILHALEATGVRVWNRARAIERSVDKSTATFLFHRAGLPVPPTVTVEGRESAERALSRVAVPAVSKPLFGAQGVGIVRVDAGEGLPAENDVGSVYYLQTLIAPQRPPDTAAVGRSELRSGSQPPNTRSGEACAFEDWRVLVSAGRVVAAMARRSGHWITNVHQGGAPAAIEPDPDMADLALAAAAAVGADYGGVDLIRGPDGRLLVLEVNSNPAWRGLQSVTGIDIADALAGDMLAALGHMCEVGPAADASEGASLPRQG